MPNLKKSEFLVIAKLLGLKVEFDFPKSFYTFLAKLGLLENSKNIFVKTSRFRSFKKLKKIYLQILDCDEFKHFYFLLHL